MVPASHVFEGMRAALLTGAIEWNQLGWALLLNIVWLLGTSLLFSRQFQVARTRGALLSIGE